MAEIVFNPESDKCIFCASDQLKKIRAKASDAKEDTNINIIECEDCCFAWQYPFGRTEHESVTFFETAYGDNGDAQSTYFNSGRKSTIAALELDFIEGLPVSNKTLLDIGAGDGTFAEVAAERDWMVTAVDPAIDENKSGRNQTIQVVRGKIDDIPSDKRYDVITLWDVIEHTDDPSEVIKNARERLKDGGWLIVETGNYKSENRVKRWINHWMYQLDHRWYFSPGSMKMLMEDKGFSKFIVSEKMLRPGWKGTIAAKMPPWIHLIKWVFKEPFKLTAHLEKYATMKKVKSWSMPGIGIFTIAGQYFRKNS